MNKKNEPVFVVKKMWDEGTTSPFPARLMLQMFNFRDALLIDKKGKDDFDKAYSPILENYKGLSLAITKLKELKEAHIKEVAMGNVVEIRSDKQIDIKKSIDDDYREGIKDIFIKGEMTIAGLPNLGNIFGLKISFLFKDEKKFNKGAEELVNKWGPSAKFILHKINEARKKWYEEFNEYRNHIEHRQVEISDIEYSLNSNGKFDTHFPYISDGTDLLDMLEILKGKILELVEDTIMFFFSTKLKPGQVIKEIPKEERDPKIAKKYAIYMQFKDGQEVRYGNT